MSFSTAEFVEGFAAETNEHLDSINDGIIAFKKNPQDNEILAMILREMHTIKGTGRMMGFPNIEAISHAIEDVFKGIRDNRYQLTDRVVELTFVASDLLKETLKIIKNTGTDNLDISAYLELCEKASQGLFFSVDELKLKKGDGGSLQEEENSEENEGSLENITSIRIELNRINEIIRSFDNLIIRQFRFKNQLEKFEAKLAALGGTELPKQLKEELLLTETAIFDTQHQLLNLRMLPLNMVLNPLRKEVEMDAMRLSKNIDFDIPSTDFMLDKAILEKLKEILLHLVRNSIDHGIETPQERKEKGKSEKGKISISSQQISNHIKITVSDDGRGIQSEKVREKAIKLFPEQRDEIEKMNEKELQQYLFISGFSTNDNPNALSGRGVGMDVVRTNMEKIKGRIHIKSAKDQGTSFELTIPLSLATQQGLFVHTGDMKLMIPSHCIVEVLDVDVDAFTTLQNQTFVSMYGRLIPVYHLSSITGTEKNDAAHSLIIVEYLETRIGIIVDSIDQYENVVVNPLPKIFGKMEALQGVVYDENYAIIPILNISDIIRRLKGLLAYDVKKYQSKNRHKVYTVLIADDSPTTRQIEQTIFETSGYKVVTAVDGIEALEKLRTLKIDAVITDIKMPRMDGYVLLENMRRLDDYANTPVIVVSGVYDPETKEKFLSAGASAFIVKSEFQRGNLLQAAKELIGE